MMPTRSRTARHLGGDQIKGVGAAELQLFDKASGGEILRPLPAVHLGHNRALGLQHLVKRRDAARAAGLDLAPRQGVSNML